MFLAEFQNINNSGQVNTSQLNCFTFGFDNTQQGNMSGEHSPLTWLSVQPVWLQATEGLILAAEVVSCGKRTLARMWACHLEFKTIETWWQSFSAGWSSSSAWGLGLWSQDLGHFLTGDLEKMPFKKTILIFRVLGTGALYFVLASVEVPTTLSQNKNTNNQREIFPCPIHMFRFCPIPGVPTCDPPKERPQQQNFAGSRPSCCYWRLNMLVMKQSREHKGKERTKEDFFFFSPL